MSKSNKTVLSKRDMNFFSEFSSSSGMSTSSTSLILLILLIFIIIGVGVYGIFYFKTASLNASIQTLNAEMATEEYQTPFHQYTSINSDLNLYNQQYYDISTLFYRVSDMGRIESKYMDTIQEKLPEDITLTDFSYADGSITLTGLASSYYSPLDFIANLSASETFTYVDISSITQQDLSVFTPEEQVLMKPYLFTLVGSIESTYPLTVSKMMDGVVATPLTAVSSTNYKIGDTYKVEGINSLTSGQNVYTLSKVEIDHVAVSDPNAFAAIQQADAITGTITSAENIVLYYTLSATIGGGQ